jgi:membrane protein implicated in regulation of membrane protease activity
MTMFEIRVLAVIIACAIGGIILLPDRAFFALIGAAMIAAGIALLGWSKPVAISGMVAGVVSLAWGLRLLLRDMRKEEEEADKAMNEVQNRMGRVYTPEERKRQ